MLNSNSDENRSLILIVDDTPINLQILGSFLKKYNYRVALSQSGKDAIEFVQNKKIDLILLDIMMPEMNGFEVCKKLKSNSATKDIPVLFITALTDTTSKLKAFEAGGLDYITKPFLPEEVLARVKVNILRRQYERALIESSQMKSDFVSSVSHELRTPLTSILGFSSTILNDPNMDSATQREFVKIIYDESKRLSRLIENVLSISRIESRTISYNLEPVNINPLIEEVYHSQKILCESKGIKIKYDMENHPTKVNADRDAIKQTLLNLVGNAIKFSNKGGIVKMTLSTNGSFAELRIEDNGLGIPEKDLPRIFEKFYRVHRPGTEIEGTGLGLPIVKEIVESHQGKIEVYSAEGKGTTFKILLPLQE